jgi:starch-binding outer membrane protein SusE/F
MKRYINLALSGFLLMTVFAGCKREIPTITFEGGNKPKLEASVNDVIPLSLATKDNSALTISWTNPEYRLSTGVSSQDVTYNIEIDTVGSGFSSSIKEVKVLKNALSYTFTQDEINRIIYLNMEMPIGVQDSIAVRVVAMLGDAPSTRVISNVLRFAVTPYNDPAIAPPDLYITGNATASDWTNSPPANQQFTYLGSKKYEITMPFTPGKQYKFLTKPGNWQPQYGLPVGNTNDGTNGPAPLALNDGTGSDPDAIPTPAVAGNYKITVDLANNTFTVVKL